MYHQSRLILIKYQLLLVLNDSSTTACIAHPILCWSTGCTSVQLAAEPTSAKRSAFDQIQVDTTQRTHQRRLLFQNTNIRKCDDVLLWTDFLTWKKDREFLSAFLRPRFEPAEILNSRHGRCAKQRGFLVGDGYVSACSMLHICSRKTPALIFA